MSEKVFGISKDNAKVLLRLFREEQAKHLGRSGCYCSECEQDMREALKTFYELVNVVSLQALRKYCKEMCFETNCLSKGNGYLRNEKEFVKGYKEALKDLVSMAKKQAMETQGGEKK